MGRQRVTREEMRYKVPGVCNRFWQVHARFILLSACLCGVIIILACSYILVNGLRKMEPKYSLVFFCELDDSSQIEYITEKYANTVDVYFALYDERFSPAEDAESTDPFDFSYFGEYMENACNKPVAQCVMYMLNPELDSGTAFFYGDYGYNNGAVLTATEVERIIEEAMKA